MFIKIEVDEIHNTKKIIVLNTKRIGRIQSSGLQIFFHLTSDLSYTKTFRTSSELQNYFNYLTARLQVVDLIENPNNS